MVRHQVNGDLGLIKIHQQSFVWVTDGLEAFQIGSLISAKQSIETIWGGAYF